MSGGIAGSQPLACTTFADAIRQFDALAAARSAAEMQAAFPGHSGRSRRFFRAADAEEDPRAEEKTDWKSGQRLWHSAQTMVAEHGRHAVSTAYRTIAATGFAFLSTSR